MHTWIVRRHENGHTTQLGTIKAFTFKQALRNAQIEFGGKREKKLIHVQMVEPTR